MASRDGSISEARNGTAPRGSDWIPVTLAARKLGKTSPMVHRYIKAGLLRAQRRGLRGWKRVAREDVEKLLSGSDD